MFKYYAAIYCGAILTVIAQLLLKKGALQKTPSTNFLSGFYNYYVLLGYIIFFTVTLLNLYALNKIKLIEMIVVFPLIHLLIIVFSNILFGEKLGNNHIKGVLLIIVGIVIFQIN